MKWDRISKHRALVWGAWVLVLLIGLAGLFVWDSVRSYDIAIRRFESYIGSSKHEDYLREPVPEDRNAAIAFRTAVSGIEVDGEWSRTLEPSAWSPAAEADARDALARHARALKGLEAAADLPSCVWPPATQVDLDSSSAALTASRLLRLLGFVGVVDVDEERVARSFSILGSLADCLYAQPHLAGSMIAAAVERSRLEVVHAAVSSPGTGEDLLEIFKAVLERSSQVDRVRWAVAAEGALAFRLLDEGRPGSVPTKRGLLRMAFSRRVAIAVASRWAELKVWSEKPFEELLRETEREAPSGTAVAGLVADLLMPNLRSAIVTLRTNRALTGLALVAIEARLYGRRHGSYTGAFDGQAGIDVLNEGDGSNVLIDSELESLLRAYLVSAGAGETPGAESTLDLTVWRLPPPGRERPPG